MSLLTCTFGLEYLTFFTTFYGVSRTRHLPVVIQYHDFKKWDFTERKKFLDSIEITEIRSYCSIFWCFSNEQLRSQNWNSKYPARLSTLVLSPIWLTVLIENCVAIIGIKDNKNTFNAFKQRTYICEPGDFDYFLLQI